MRHLVNRLLEGARALLDYLLTLVLHVVPRALRVRLGPSYLIQRDFSAAGSWKTPPKVLAQLAGTGDGHISELVAINSSTPLALLEELVEHPDSSVGWTLARRENLPSFLLARLAGSPHVGVRRAVARRAYVPSSILELLVQDPSIDVRKEVVGNYYAGDHVLVKANPRLLDRYGRLLPLLEHLPETEQEVALALSVNWEGSLEELLTATTLV